MTLHMYYSHVLSLLKMTECFWRKKNKNMKNLQMDGLELHFHLTSLDSFVLNEKHVIVEYKHAVFSLLHNFIILSCIII